MQLFILFCKMFNISFHENSLSSSFYKKIKYFPVFERVTHDYLQILRNLLVLYPKKKEKKGKKLISFQLKVKE